MDFVDWCDLILATCIKTGRTFRFLMFSFANELVAELNIQNFGGQSTYFKGFHNAFDELKRVGLIEEDTHMGLLNITRDGREYCEDKIPLWWKICQEKLEKEHEQVLGIINRLSQKTAQDHAWLELVSVNYQTVASELGGRVTDSRVWTILHELEHWGFVFGWFLSDGTATLHSTFKGLVWETRRGFTIESKFIDDLVAEWETTSVEFKSDLYTDKAGQVAEFIKDVLSLATTKASGQRWMIIGFDDDTHEYCGTPNPKLTQNHLEQLLQEYTKPLVKVRYQEVDYRKRLVGKMEVFRDPKHLPYKVAKSLGGQNDKRRIIEGDIYVRHGSQVQKPTSEELQALQEEGDQARLAP